MENNQLLELQLQEAVLLNKPALLDFVSYKHDDKEKFGIILEKLEYGQALSVIVPLFQKENNTFSLLTNSENTVIADSEIKTVLDKQKGINTWKDVIKNTGSNPTLELEAKLINFVPKIVTDNLNTPNFSLKKTFDDCMLQNQQMLSQLSSEIPLEKIFDKVINDIINHSLSKNVGNKKGNKETLNKINAIQFEKLDLKNKIVSIIESIDNEHKNDDVQFINNFKQRFENNSITKEDVNSLNTKFQQITNGIRSSDIINDFVNKKKGEILNSNNLQIPIHQINNPLSNGSDLVAGEKIAVHIDDTFHYGLFVRYDEEDSKIVLKGDDNKNMTLIMDESSTIYHLFQTQEILELHLKEKLHRETNLINWDDLSFNNQLQLLKGQNTNLLLGVDNNSKDELEFKIFIYRVGDAFELKAHTKNNIAVDLNNYEFKGSKLNEEEILKLEKNEVIIFEVFDKDGTLQFAHDMKYDRDLNDIVVSPDKGIDYARNPKQGKEQGYYAKTRIENRSTNTIPKI